MAANMRLKYFFFGAKSISMLITLSFVKRLLEGGIVIFVIGNNQPLSHQPILN